MKPTIKSALICAAIWIMIKLSVFGMGKSTEYYNFIVLSNIFLLLSAISFGLYFYKRKQVDDGNALTDIKSGIAAGMVYTLIVSAFVFFYYQSIDQDFIKNRLSDTKALFEKTLQDPVKLKELRKSNEAFETMSLEELRKKNYESFEANISPKAVTLITLLGMLFLSTINSLITTVIFRQVVFNKKALK